MKFKNYAKPQNLAEAYQILQNEKNAVILGGNTYLRWNKKTFSTAIDLENLGLNFIKENDENIEIGAYTTLHEIETNAIIKKYFGDFFTKSLKHIVGIQFRNIATIGGSICGKYGFSELITALSVLNCTLVFHQNGVIAFKDFIENSQTKNDILVKIIIPKKCGRLSYKMLRNADSDFPILTVAVNKNSQLNIAIGSCPTVAKLISAKNELENISEFISQNFTFGNDLRATASYRENIASVLLKRALEETL